MKNSDLGSCSKATSSGCGEGHPLRVTTLGSSPRTCRVLQKMTGLPSLAQRAFSYWHVCVGSSVSFMCT